MRRGSSRPVSQCPAQEREGFATEPHTVTVQLHSHMTTPPRRLIAKQRCTAEFRRPKDRQSTVGRTSHRILGNTACRREEARYEIVIGRITEGRDYHAANGELRESREVGNQPPDCGSVRNFQQKIKTSAATELNLISGQTQRFDKPARDV
jgi:hypothetical protein